MENPGEIPFPGSGLPEEKDVSVRRPDVGGKTTHTVGKVIPVVSPMTHLFLHFTFPPFSSIESSRDAERIEPLGIAASTYTDGSQSRIVQSGVSPGVRRKRGR